MRGFLQRLALGVIRPTETIHPMVGSVFSAPHHAASREALPRRESGFVSLEPKAHSIPNQEEGEIRSHAEQEKPVVTSGSLETSRLRAPEPISIYTPLISTTEPLQSKSRQPEKSRTAQELTSSSDPGNKAIVEMPPQPNEHTTGRAQEVLVKHVYTPAMSDSAVRSSGLKVPAQQTEPAARRSTPQESSSRRSGTPSRQPDEIQIHIGRIEVTAVHQTPAPPVVKPARKGLSLDEYLQRANRRGR